jgi:frataxin-like iron-binding protein CyaY
VIGFNSPAAELTIFKSQLIPSIGIVISNIGGEMAPWDDASAYRWINRDNPFKSGDAGDVERFGYAKAEYGNLLSNCNKPRALRAHAVNDDHYLNTAAPAPDKLEFFNARDGLKCVAANQPDGQCNDYATSYRCNGVWTTQQNHAPTGTGDDESRSRQSGICANPTAIQAFTQSGRGVMTLNGPKDRLVQFDAEGLECRNADQGAGQSCSNYVVKFADCDSVSLAPTYNLVSSSANKDLTATSSASGAEVRSQTDNNDWTTQNWTVEPVSGTRHVRLRNGSGRYLAVQSTGENAKVIIVNSGTSTTQQWISEPVAGSNDVRLRNVAAGRYITVVDNNEFAQVLSQSLNSANWATQRWKIQKQTF